MFAADYNQLPLLAEDNSLEECSEPAAVADSHLKALIVDDFLIERRMVQRFAGLTILEASDGIEAMEVIERESPAVVVTDLQMPRMNGLQLVEAG